MYIGSRSCNLEPEKDIGFNYFSSSTDKEFITDQMDNPFDYIYDIIKVFDNRVDAMALEIKLHNEFDVAKNQLFYNRAKQTSIGFCVHGMKHSADARNKISDMRKGQKHSDETKKKMSDVHVGMTGQKHSDETKKKMSDVKKGMTGQKHSDETKKKMSESKNGKKHSVETTKKIAESHVGMTGQKHSAHAKKKMSDAQKGIPKETCKCPHCLKVCSLGMLSRWHLDNCKLNPNKQD